MKKMKLKKFLTSSSVSIGAFALAAVLLAGASVGGARAALTYVSEFYSSRVQMEDIGVSLNENGNKVSWRDYDNEKRDGTWNENIGVLLENMIPEGEELEVGRAYPEAISVTNSGVINEYVRVTLTKSWTDAEGNKLTNLDPSLIDLNLVNIGSDWTIDESASTEERTVLYYNYLLNSGDTTPALSDTIKIDELAEVSVSQETYVDDEGYTVIETTYDYNGAIFHLKASVDAVQEHNAEDAIRSAWGKNVTVSNNTLTLN